MIYDEPTKKFLKENLPYDFCKQVMKRLKKKGRKVHRTQVSNVRAERREDDEIAVEILEVAKAHKARTDKFRARLTIKA